VHVGGNRERRAEQVDGAVKVRTIGPVDPISGVDLDAAREVDAAVDEALGSCTMFIG
jgi:hypothetical protein